MTCWTPVAPLWFLWALLPWHWTCVSPGWPPLPWGQAGVWDWGWGLWWGCWTAWLGSLSPWLWCGGRKSPLVVGWRTQTTVLWHLQKKTKAESATVPKLNWSCCQLLCKKNKTKQYCSSAGLLVLSTILSEHVFWSTFPLVIFVQFLDDKNATPPTCFSVHPVVSVTKATL